MKCVIFIINFLLICLANGRKVRTLTKPITVKKGAQIRLSENTKKIHASVWIETAKETWYSYSYGKAEDGPVSPSKNTDIVYKGEVDSKEHDRAPTAEGDYRFAATGVTTKEYTDDDIYEMTDELFCAGGFARYVYRTKNCYDYAIELFIMLTKPDAAEIKRNFINQKGWQK